MGCKTERLDCWMSDRTDGMSGRQTGYQAERLDVRQIVMMSDRQIGCQTDSNDVRQTDVMSDR